MSEHGPSRRRLIGGVTSALAAIALAGCGGGTGGSDGSGSGDDPGPGDPGSTDGNESRGEEGEGGLDLREANVVGVAVEGGAPSDFDVTLHHDDDGEDGYADWWQVERLDGTRLGRRELLHAHSTQPFTRSETIDIPDDVSCVVVRGHDRTHGYGGRAMLVALDSGETRAVDQGPESGSFDAGDCP